MQNAVCYIGESQVSLLKITLNFAVGATFRLEPKQVLLTEFYA